MRMALITPMAIVSMRIKKLVTAVNSFHTTAVAVSGLLPLKTENLRVKKAAMDDNASQRV